MVKFLINRPVAVLMTFFALLLLGVFSSFLLPVSLLPNINIPEITVKVSYPGKPAVEMEQTVVSQLRMQLLQIPGLDDMQSEARDGEATIRLKFDYGVNIDFIFVEVNEKVDMAMADLPREVPRPRVIKASASDLPVFNINIQYADTSNLTPTRMLDLSQAASKVIRKRVEQLPEVALADITGTTSPQLVIEPDRGKLRALGIGAEQIQAALNQSMFELGSLRLREGQLVYDVIIEQNVVQPSDINKIPINAGGRVFSLSELATITLQPARAQGTYLYNGSPAICMPVVKHTNARMGDMKKAVDKLVVQLQNDYPELNINLSHDQTKILDYSIVNLRNSLIAGVLLAVSVMFLFLGDYRNPILMGITIPVSLVVGMMFFHLTGLSVNIVSLSGLILGVGMMIDNSIVVIDNITQWRARGTPLHDAITSGTNEVIRPLLSSMLTTIAVFIPLVFLSGLSGAMFRDQALAVSIGLGVSFWVSITLLPTLYYRLNLKRADKWVAKSGLIPLVSSYKAGFNMVFQRRNLFLLISLLLIGLAPVLFLRIEKRQMPELTRIETVANIAWGSNISVDENIRRCSDLLRAVEGDVTESAFYVGQQQLLLARGMEMGESDASLYFRFNGNTTIDKLNQKILEWVNAHYPTANLGFAFAESAFERIFPAPEARLIVKVAGGEGELIPSTQAMEGLTDKLQVNFPNLAIERVPQQMQLHLVLNPTALSLYNIDVNSVKQAIEVAMQSNRVGRLAFEQQVLPIVFGDKPEPMQQMLEQITVKNSNGADIPIRNLVSTTELSGFRSIYGDNSGAFIPLKINGTDGDIVQSHQYLQKVNSENQKINLSFTGDYFSSQVLVWELVGVLLVSVLLLYFILAAQFESLKQPLIVLLELPIDIAGALAIVWLLGGTLNLMTMIGLVVMGGIIVNDSILKIDTINRLRTEGFTLMDAIAEGGKRRLKPIVMTSVTTILALVPILVGHDLGSELQQPLALATIGGMAFGTLISLYFIPLVYWWLYREHDK
ncbi:MAG: efflux RND transporter permease subunit [Bacteroidales bacterium]|nr:efflux RND transporter permease subunit [Bacteroidales bacterium]